MRACQPERTVREKVNEARRRAKALTRKWRLAMGGGGSAARRPPGWAGVHDA